MTDTRISLQNQSPGQFRESEGTLRFFDSVLKKVEDAKIHSRTMLETKELKMMIMEMRMKMDRNEIILGTKDEQQAFLAKIESFLTNPGVFDPVKIKENLQTIIEEEFTRGISRARILSLGLDYKKASDGYSCPAIGENTIIVPMDLHLAFLPTDTVEHVCSRLEWQYASRSFNAVILLAKDKTFTGIIPIASLRRARDTDKNTTLGDLESEIIDRYGFLKTPNESIERSMNELGVNIFPIISDEEKRLLLGIQTRENVTVSVTRYYTTQLATQVGGDILKSEVEGKKTGETTIA